MESQPQKTKFRNNPENFRPCNIPMGETVCFLFWGEKNRSQAMTIDKTVTELFDTDIVFKGILCLAV